MSITDKHTILSGKYVYPRQVYVVLRKPTSVIKAIEGLHISLSRRPPRGRHGGGGGAQEGCYKGAEGLFFPPPPPPPRGGGGGGGGGDLRRQRSSPRPVLPSAAAGSQR